MPQQSGTGKDIKCSWKYACRLMISCIPLVSNFFLLISHLLAGGRLIGTHCWQSGSSLYCEYVPNGLEIPRLRDHLVKIITYYRTESSLRHGCNDILKAGCVNLLVKYCNEAERAVCLSNEDDARPKRDTSRASQTKHLAGRVLMQSCLSYNLLDGLHRNQYQRKKRRLELPLEGYTSTRRRMLTTMVARPLILGCDRPPIGDDLAIIGFLNDNAIRFNALLVYIEHRYYGKSIPFGSSEEAFKNASTMGVFQLCTSYAEITMHIKKKLRAFYSPVIVIGGSYGGSN
ncbi:putative Serine carboxypeptidase S28 family protein [Hibiscus syriacus]|uniref:Serine carboxypeptidase S28 family protein n=1 Tax=Hibiscus syriacus TaxID=106335 RepID=A0A6A2YGY5_HIBSY|nr:putative Serine carboxypeptidase S28 family protein [Hibiscus syriacus]